MKYKKTSLIYFLLFYSYQNITSKLKREWYQFQLDVNAVATEFFGEDEDVSEKEDSVEYFNDDDG